MSTEVMPVIGEDDRDFTEVGPQEDIVIEERDLARSAIVIHGGGANTEHFALAIRALTEDHEVHIVEVQEPKIPFPGTHLHLINPETGEGQDVVDKLYESPQGVHAAYGSLTPDRHVPFLIKSFEYIGDGKLDEVVVPKPPFPFEDLRRVDIAKRAMDEKLTRQFGPEYVADNPKVFFHEHYIGKGSEKTLREKMGLVMAILGRPIRFEMHIEERRKAEEEGRVEAFGSATADFGPHFISVMRDFQTAINETTQYTASDQAKYSVERFRYEDSELLEGVETGLIVRGSTAIIDHTRNDEEDIVSFDGYMGKGVPVDRKDLIVEFVHPDTGEVSTIRADLLENTLEVPDSVKHLFPEIEFKDNGYGFSVKHGLDGLNGGDPRESFQSYDDARIVVKWGGLIARLGGANPPHIYSRENTDAVSLQELSQRFQKQTPEDVLVS